MATNILKERQLELANNLINTVAPALASWLLPSSNLPPLALPSPLLPLPLPSGRNRSPSPSYPPCYLPPSHRSLWSIHDLDLLRKYARNHPNISDLEIAEIIFKEKKLHNRTRTKNGIAQKLTSLSKNKKKKRINKHDDEEEEEEEEESEEEKEKKKKKKPLKPKGKTTPKPKEKGGVPLKKRRQAAPPPKEN